MQQEQATSRNQTFELSSRNAARASELIRQGRANLQVSVYPWGVELALAQSFSPEFEEASLDAE